jgi:glucokinase
LSTARHVGIDLGGTAIKAGAISPRGDILERRSIASGVELGAGEVLDRIAQVARELGATRALGLGTPGLIDRGGKCILESPNLPCVRGVRLARELSQRLAIDEASIEIENDANAAALGEHWLGAARDEESVMVVTLGTGIGGGLILSGALHRGPGGMAGEIGHVVVDPNGPTCGCGARGCLETLASASAASARALACGLPTAAPGDLVLLARRARDHAGAERALLLEVGRDLGRGLAAVVTLLDLRSFVIGGGFGAALDVLEPGIRAGIHERSYGDRHGAVRIRPALLGADAGWIGAAKLTLAD